MGLGIELQAGLKAQSEAGRAGGGGQDGVWGARLGPGRASTTPGPSGGVLGPSPFYSCEQKAAPAPASRPAARSFPQLPELLGEKSGILRPARASPEPAPQLNAVVN